MTRRVVAGYSRSCVVSVFGRTFKVYLADKTAGQIVTSTREAGNSIDKLGSFSGRQE